MTAESEIAADEVSVLRGPYVVAGIIDGGVYHVKCANELARRSGVGIYPIQYDTTFPYEPTCPLCEGSVPVPVEKSRQGSGQWPRDTPREWPDQGPGEV